jgi:molybdenum cofactor cytidylyltransferase
MKFGSIPLSGALGAVLAHSLDANGKRLRKGLVLTCEDIANLEAAGTDHVIAAHLDADDSGENEAATAIAVALVNAAPHLRAGPSGTGRVNLYAEPGGVFEASETAVRALNSIDPGITVATLPDSTFVRSGRMVATVKIIPFAVPQKAVTEAILIPQTAPAMTLAPARKKRVALVATRLPVLKASVMEKTKGVLEDRLARLGCVLVHDATCNHDTNALAEALGQVRNADITIVFGASAITDRQDVIPGAVESLPGGRVERFGMPVDPGNLLLLGAVDDMTIIGAPGCARSPVKNGFDWVLERLVCDVPVDQDWWLGTGVGGLLIEAEDRPQPREQT